MSKEDGGPAFPVQRDTALLAALGPKTGALGMTLRDYFAGKAMQGFCSNPSMIDNNDSRAVSYVADAAYAMADAMIAERAK